MKDLNVSQRVKALRNQKGMTQEALAENSGLSLRTIQRIENNETQPRGDSLKRLAIALKTTPDDLLEWTIQEDHRVLNINELIGTWFFILSYFRNHHSFSILDSEKRQIETCRQHRKIYFKF